MFNSNKFWLNHKDSLFELQIPNNKDLLILVNKINQNKNTCYWTKFDSYIENVIKFKEIQKHKNDYIFKLKRGKINQ